MLDLSSWSARFFFISIALILAFFLFFPIYWCAVSALKSDGELYRIVPTLWPESMTLEHFRTAVGRGDLPLHLKNSLIASGSSALLNTVLAIYAGYSFAKFRYAGRKSAMLFILSAQIRDRA